MAKHERSDEAGTARGKAAGAKGEAAARRGAGAKAEGATPKSAARAGKPGAAAGKGARAGAAGAAGKATAGRGEATGASAKRGGERSRAPTVTKREFLRRVAAETDLPTSQVGRLVDVVLAELGRALSAGEALSLKPLGRLRPSQKGTGESGVMGLRLRRMEDDPAPAGRGAAAADATAAAVTGIEGDADLFDEGDDSDL